MKEEESLRKALAELNTLTGLNLSMEKQPEDMSAAAEKISLITEAYREKNSKTSYLQKLLAGRLSTAEIYSQAVRFHVPPEEKRAVFVIETKNVSDENILTVLKQLFMTKTHDFAMMADELRLVLIKSLKEDEGDESLRITAHTIVDMLNTEAMARVRVGYGNVIHDISEMPVAYREARLSLEIGRIFYIGENVIRYSRLGIGRLIYQLPEDTCRLFLSEVFGQKMQVSFDDETVATINTFFDNNLNISETARQLYVHRNTLVYRLEKIHQATGLDIRVFEDAMTFKIASMVAAYLKDKEETTK